MKLMNNKIKKILRKIKIILHPISFHELIAKYHNNNKVYQKKKKSIQKPYLIF